MYFSVLNGLSQTLNNKLQKLQYCAARVIITKSRYDASAGPLLNMLGWDRVLISLIKQKAVVMSKTLNNQNAPLRARYYVLCSWFLLQYPALWEHLACTQNQGLSILSEILGVQGLSFGMDCHTSYVSR